MEAVPSILVGVNHSSGRSTARMELAQPASDSLPGNFIATEGPTDKDGRGKSHRRRVGPKAITKQQ
jgi:hypothetical protein